MKKLVFLSLLSVALLTSCGNGAQKDALKAQNDSLMVELSNRNAELTISWVLSMKYRKVFVR